MVLSAVICRAHSDYGAGNPDAEELLERTSAWVDQLDLRGEMEPSEHKLIDAKIGTLRDRERINATWQTEGLAILAWGLKLFPFPSLDKLVDLYELTDAFYFLNDEAMDVIRSAALRSEHELEACRELFYAVHCRLRQFARNRHTHDMRHWIEPNWIETLKLDNIFAVDGDLLVGSVPLIDSQEEVWQRMEFATRERHRAAIWLIGEQWPTYCDFPVDT
jgi:hypothetical protein